MRKPPARRRSAWAEFVEAGLLRQYRRIHNVPMVELRNFIDSLRHRLEVPYPLAHERPFVSGRQLVREAQEEAGIDGEYALVAEASGQYILSAAAQEFFERVTWSTARLSVGDPMPVRNHRLSSIQSALRCTLSGRDQHRSLVGAVRRRRGRPGPR